MIAYDNKIFKSQPCYNYCRHRVVMDNGTERVWSWRCISYSTIPPGHNAWVVGNEPVVAVDFTGLKDYAKK
jgi:hypothetical protein